MNSKETRTLSLRGPIIMCETPALFSSSEFSWFLIILDIADQFCKKKKIKKNPQLLNGMVRILWHGVEMALKHSVVAEANKNPTQSNTSLKMYIDIE